MLLEEKGKPLTKTNQKSKQTNKNRWAIPGPVSERIADSCGQVCGPFADSGIAEHALCTVVNVSSVFAGSVRIQTLRFASW